MAIKAVQARRQIRKDPEETSLKEATALLAELREATRLMARAERHLTDAFIQPAASPPLARTGSGSEVIILPPRPPPPPGP